jgi:uncharacterized protein
MVGSSAKLNRREVVASLLLATTAVAACGPVASKTKRVVSKKAARLIAAARSQIGITRSYDPAYTAIPYPNGDVPRALGVCTDVIIRAYRDAFGIDLQQLVHEDMTADFAAYPTQWGLERPDRNIDHRRVLNLRAYMARQKADLAITRHVKDWQPGDILTSMVGGKLPHIGIVSDREVQGRPLVIHNIGSGTQEEDILFAHSINGHYRWRLA